MSVYMFIKYTSSKYIITKQIYWNTTKFIPNLLPTKQIYWNPTKFIPDLFSLSESIIIYLIIFIMRYK